MAFWKVAGFSQPSPIEQILDKEEFTLEELLDEDDIIQECKSLNTRLITFLKEKKTVEQLLRYLIDPPTDSDDPKKQYRYPFTSCEVFCCEVEAVFNTLLEDEDLLRLLFSLLDQDPPLSCKSAGYFGRVVGQLLLRKTNEMMQHLSHNEEILEKLIKHVDTTSIADIIKRLVGADDHSSMIFSPMHTQWLADTPLVTMLLDRLGPEYSSLVQANAADILTAIAHTQPSALATQLMQQQSIEALFSRALQPGSRVMVTALDVCAALLEPRRALDPGVLPGPPSTGATDNGGPMPSGGSGSGSHAASQAITSMLLYLPQLMQHLRAPLADCTSNHHSSASPDGNHKGSSSNGQRADAGTEASAGGACSEQADCSTATVKQGGDVSDGGDTSSSAQMAAEATDTCQHASGDQTNSASSTSTDHNGSNSSCDIAVRQETPYGVLQPPLGPARLRIVELLAVLLRVGDDAVDAAFIEAQSLLIVQELFVAYPFNNLLHHQLYALVLAVLHRASPVMVSHVFGDCQLVSWLRNLPETVTPIPRPGFEAKLQLRAGYLGHVTRIGQVLQEAAAQQQEIADVLQADPSWPELLQQLMPRFELEDITRWQCGRPANTDGNELDSDGDEFPNDMESLEPIQGMPPSMYHRYGVLDDDMEDEDDETADSSNDFAGGTNAGTAGASAGMYSAEMLVAGMAGLEVSEDADAPGAAAVVGAEGVDGAESAEGPGQGNWSLLAHPGPSSSAVDIPGERLMDNDAVLLADDEDMGALTASTMVDSPPAADLDSISTVLSPVDDMVLVEDAAVVQAAAQASQDGQLASSSSSSAADTPMAEATTVERQLSAQEPAPADCLGDVAPSLAPASAPISGNPFAAAPIVEPSSKHVDDINATHAVGDSQIHAPVAAESADSTAANGPRLAAAEATATATVEKAPGELGADSKGLLRDSNVKRQAMASFPVEVSDEMS